MLWVLAHLVPAARYKLFLPRRNRHALCCSKCNRPLGHTDVLGGKCGWCREKAAYSL